MLKAQPVSMCCSGSCRLGLVDDASRCGCCLLTRRLLLLPLLLLLRCSWYTYLLLARMHEVPDLDNKAGNGVRRLDRCDTYELEGLSFLCSWLLFCCFSVPGSSFAVSLFLAAPLLLADSGFGSWSVGRCGLYDNRLACLGHAALVLICACASFVWLCMCRMSRQATASGGWTGAAHTAVYVA
jgi:hypothetical protein